MGAVPAALVLVALVLLVLVLARRGAGARVQVRTCCSARPWPPVDLTGDAPAAERPRA